MNHTVFPPFIAVRIPPTACGSGDTLPAHLPPHVPPKQTLLPWLSFSRQLSTVSHSSISYATTHPLRHAPQPQPHPQPHPTLHTPSPPPPPALSTRATGLCRLPCPAAAAVPGVLQQHRHHARTHGGGHQLLQRPQRWLQRAQGACVHVQGAGDQHAQRQGAGGQQLGCATHCYPDLLLLCHHGCCSWWRGP